MLGLKISWQGVALVAVVVAAAVLVGLYGPAELALILAGLAGGLVPRAGAVSR